MSNVVQLKPPLYEAKCFSANTEAGQFVASGTLCGHIDFAIPNGPTYVLSPVEVLSVIMMLQNAQGDVLQNSDPIHDPRLYSKSEDGQLLY